MQTFPSDFLLTVQCNGCLFLDILVKYRNLEYINFINDNDKRHLHEHWLI